MAGKHKRRLSMSRTTLIIALLSVTLTIGITVGAIMANTIDGEKYDELSGFISGFIENFSTSTASKSDAFKEAIVKYGKILVLIWFFGFVTYGIFFIFLIIFMKGLSYGFTTALIVRQLGLNGLTYAAALYIPQNLILVPVYFCVSYFSINYILNSLNDRQKNSDTRFKEYVMVLLLCGVLVLLAVLAELFLVPAIMGMLA